MEQKNTQMVGRKHGFKAYRIYSAIRRLVYKTRGMFWPLRERILLSLAYKTGLNFCKFPTSHQCLHCV